MYSKSVIVSLMVILALVGAGFLVFKSPKPVTEKLAITNFDECAKAGYPVTSSYPAECRSASGELFVQAIPNPVPNPIPPSPVPPKPAPAGTGYVTGHITIGPFCPVERVGHPCLVPPEAYSSRKVVVYASNGTTVKQQANIDANGDYKVALSAGNYFLQISPAGIGPGEKKPVTVKANQTIVVDFNIDTGIR